MRSSEPGRARADGASMTRARGLVPIRGALCAVLVTLAARAPAQRLQLGQPEEPTLGTSSFVAQLTEHLQDESRRLRTRRDEPERVRAAIALRSLAIALLRSPDENSPQRILWGITLASHLGELDRLMLDADGPIDRAACVLLARDLAIPPADLPEDLAELDRLLRDALAELAQEATAQGAAAGTVFGWVPDEPEQPVAVAAFDAMRDQLAEADGVDALALTRLGELDELLTTAEAWTAYRQTAGRTRRMVLEASAAVTHQPTWLDDQTHGLLIGIFDQAVVGLGEPELRERSRSDLDLLTRLAVLIDLLDGLEPSDPVEAARAALADLVASAIDGSADRSRLGVAQRVLDLAHERLDLPDERAVVRPLRPAWRTLLVMARKTEGPILAALPAILRDQSAISDPGIVSAISAHRRAIADLQGMALISDLLAGPRTPGREPTVDEARRVLARRVLKLGQALDDANADEALVTLRLLIDQIDRYRVLPGETSLRNSTMAGAWNAVTGDRRDGLIDQIDAARTAWLAAWTDDDALEIESTGDRLELLTGLMLALRDGVTLLGVLAGPRPSPASAWPGWELSREALRTLTNGLPARLGETTRLVVAGNTTRAGERLARDEPLIRLIALLERGARAHGLGRSSSDSWLELASGTPEPRRAWLVDRRRDLALVSRYARELADARQRGDDRSERAIERFVHARAAIALDHLDPRRTH